VLLVLAAFAAMAVWLYRLSWFYFVSARAGVGFAADHKSLIHFCAAGQRDGFRVEISQRLVDTLGSTLLIDIDGRGRIPPDLDLSTETAKTRAQAQDIVTEDQLFDYTALVYGSEAAALALLDHDTRRTVIDLLSRGGVVSHGLIRAYSSSLKLRELIPNLIRVAGSLSLRKAEIPDRLFNNMKNDRKIEVRARNFVVLQQHFAGSKLAEQAAEIARSSPEPLMRLEAAIFDQDHEKLSEIASNPEYAVLLRVRAVDKLTRASWAEVATPVLMELLHDKDLQVQMAATTGLGWFRHHAAVDRLIELSTSFSSELVRAAAEALGRIGDPAAEATLVYLLGHRDTHVLETAVKALGRAGTVMAVEPLMEAGERLTSTSDKELVEESIRRIQNRLAGADRGQLSIAAPAEADGRLSIADEVVEGGVSLADGQEQEASTE
jgi:hypothetical protein